MTPPQRPDPHTVSRRTLLRTTGATALAVVAGPLLAACTSDSPDRTGSSSSARADSRSPSNPAAAASSSRSAGADSNRPAGRRVLLAYFSRRGENYYYGGRRDLQTGNTEVLARMISDAINCDVYRIEPAEPYSRDYDATVARNVREQDSDARPKIARALPDVGDYDIVLLASPIWNVRTPMIMRTFTDGVNLRGKTVHPVVTYAVSGLANTEDDYRQACPGARVGTGLGVQGERVSQAGAAVTTWLTRTNLSHATTAK
ncbi:flavodoxin [uncultured Jatrophihabitans sp.]|uniref:flavodoxin n=1 Tax=uncultured Jatrophihabitans sp. TaxID=1610747 RepID=UPI0035CA52E4